MLKNRILMIAALSLVAVLVAAGCGSDSDDSSASGGTDASLTKAQFIKEADAICNKGNKRKLALFRSYGKKNELGEQKPLQGQSMEDLISNVLLPEVQKQAEALGEMTTPPGEEAKVDAVVEAVEDSIKKAEPDPESVLTRGTSPFLASNKVAQEYGFEVCGQN
jgi:hypothetical protein